MSEIDNLRAENAELKDEVARLNGIPQCAFCRRRATYQCCQRPCKAPICEDHATSAGTTHINTANPKAHQFFVHMMCHRCSGISTSETSGPVTGPDNPC